MKYICKFKKKTSYVFVKKRNKIIQELTEIINMGPSKAKELYDMGVKSVSDLKIKIKKGEIEVNSKIVLVACFSKHRKDSFESCNFIMDYLKKEAPFWKNEFYADKNEWLINTN